MYDYSEYRELTSTIRNAESSRALRSALRGFLNNAAMTWWNELSDNQRQAIILLDFDASVVTTMVFFGRDWGFGGSYGDVLELILDKAELLAQEDSTTWAPWDCDLRCIIDRARLQMEYEEEARRKAAEIVRELGMETGVKALEDLLVNNSGLVRFNKKRKEEYAKDMRKAFLGDALTYLQKHYNDNDNNEEEEDE
jgi:hypothetical protein